MGSDDHGFYLIAMRKDGKRVETKERVLPYLKKTLKKIKEKLGVFEI